MARYHQDGSLDTSFGANGDGKVTTAMRLASRERVRMAIDGSGRILAGADREQTAGVLIRYNEDGSLDGSLGTGGIVTVDGLRAVDLAVAADGRILVAGDAADDVALARYNERRKPGLELRVRRHRALGPGSDRCASAALALDGSGRIVVAGSSSGLDTVDFLAARYTAQGSLDTTFNGTGYVTTDVR